MITTITTCICIRYAFTYSVNADHVAYQGSLRVTSDSFMSTLLDKDSQDYKAKESKYKEMVS